MWAWCWYCIPYVWHSLLGKKVSSASNVTAKYWQTLSKEWQCNSGRGIERCTSAWKRLDLGEHSTFFQGWWNWKSFIISCHNDSQYWRRSLPRTSSLYCILNWVNDVDAGAVTPRWFMASQGEPPKMTCFQDFGDLWNKYCSSHIVDTEIWTCQIRMMSSII